MWQILFLVICFQHILLNTFRRMRLKYDNYSLRPILFYTLKQQSDYKCFIAKTFDGNTFKMKATGPLQAIKNKKQCFQFYLDSTYTLVLTTHSLRARSSTHVKFRAQKVGHLGRNLSTPVDYTCMRKIKTFISVLILQS